MWSRGGRVEWCCHMKVTDAERTEKGQKYLSGDGSRLGGDEGRLGSRKECICTGQVTDKER